MAQLTALKFEQITGLSSAKGLTAPPGTTRVLVMATAQNVRWRDDGEDPSATVGQVLVTNTEKWFAENFAVLKFFEAAPSAVLNVTYYADE